LGGRRLKASELRGGKPRFGFGYWAAKSQLTTMIGEASSCLFRQKMGTYLKIFRVVFLIAGVIGMTHTLITGRIQIKGGKWITTKSMPNNPILRSQTPRDYWFVFAMLVFIFGVLIGVFFTII
jgi:hypothetical protein